MREWFGISTVLLFSGTAFALVCAYVIRFLAVAYGSVWIAAFRQSLHLPLLKSSLMTESLIVFVE